MQRPRRGAIAFFLTVSPPVLELAVVTASITVELNPIPTKTGGGSYFEPVVIGGAGVVPMVSAQFLDCVRTHEPYIWAFF